LSAERDEEQAEIEGASSLESGYGWGRRVMPGLWSAMTVVEEGRHGLDQPLAILDPTIFGSIWATDPTSVPRLHDERRCAACRVFRNERIDRFQSEERTITPEDTLREAVLDDAREAAYQRRMSTMLAGRPRPDA
jgi:hypothetical protein